MIQVRLNTTTKTKTVNAEITATPKDIFAENGITTDGMTPTLSGCQLSQEQLNSTFEQLGVKDNTTVSLTAIVNKVCA